MFFDGKVERRQQTERGQAVVRDRKEVVEEARKAREERTKERQQKSAASIIKTFGRRQADMSKWRHQVFVPALSTQLDLIAIAAAAEKDNNNTLLLRAAIVFASTYCRRFTTSPLLISEEETKLVLRLISLIHGSLQKEGEKHFAAAAMTPSKAAVWRKAALGSIRACLAIGSAATSLDTIRVCVQVACSLGDAAFWSPVFRQDGGEREGAKMLKIAATQIAANLAAAAFSEPLAYGRMRVLTEKCLAEPALKDCAMVIASSHIRWGCGNAGAKTAVLRRAFISSFLATPASVTKSMAVLRKSMESAEFLLQVLPHSVAAVSDPAFTLSSTVTVVENLTLLCPPLQPFTISVTPVLIKLYASLLFRLKERGEGIEADAEKGIRKRLRHLLSRRLILSFLAGVSAQEGEPSADYAVYAAAFASRKGNVAVSFDLASLLLMVVEDKAMGAKYVSFVQGVIPWLWALLKCEGSLDQAIEKGGNVSNEVQAAFSLCCNCISSQMMIIDDRELKAGGGHPLPLEELQKVVVAVKSYLEQHFWLSSSTHVKADGSARNQFQLNLKNALSLLFERNSKANFCSPSLWMVRTLKDENEAARRILEEFPHALPFDQRFRMFRKWISADQEENGTDDGPVVSIRRQFLIEDSYRAFHQYSDNMLKGRIRIRFYNEQGLEEVGIDMGGVFKEFISRLTSKLLDPVLGIVQTTRSGLVYPSPDRLAGEFGACLDENPFALMEFFGRLIGKAIYDGIVVDIPFAEFFLKRVNGRGNQFQMHDLPELDEDLYKSMMNVKEYKGDIADLCLYFTVDEGGREVPLKMDGEEAEVTKDNVMEYILLYSQYKLEKQFLRQTEAFCRGLHSMIRPAWLRVFGAQEMQRLISGVRSDVDIDDLQKFTVYSGGYSSSSSTIRKFWKVVREFTPKQKTALLAFVTSVPRPPILGFSELKPRFTIHRADSGRGVIASLLGHQPDRLPSASTCMNLLKLPSYTNTSLMREKLLYAIESGAGFELS